MWRKHERRVIDGRRPSVMATLEGDLRKYLSFFGNTPREAHKLYGLVEPMVVKQVYRENRIRNKRKYGAGRIHECPLIDRMGMALMLLRGHSEQTVSHTFKVSCETARVTLMIFVRAFNKCLETPRRTTWEIVYRLRPGDLRAFMDEKASLDATVFNTTKPPDKETFDAMYRRGKGLGLNVLTVVSHGSKIVYISDPLPASVNDVSTYKRVVNEGVLALFAAVYADRGFIGANKNENIRLVHGDKKPPGGQLSEESRNKNAWINHEKYRVEQANAFLKNFGIFKKLHWYESHKLYEILQATSGLINFRTDERKKHPINWGHANRPKRRLVQKPKNAQLFPTAAK